MLYVCRKFDSENAFASGILSVHLALHTTFDWDFIDSSFSQVNVELILADWQR